MFENKGPITVTAGEALEACRRVKIKSGTTTTPPEVVYADAGEDAIGVTRYAVKINEPVAITPLNQPGILEVEVIIDSAIGIATVLYAAADGKLSDASSGSAAGIAYEAATSSGDHISVIMWSLKSTTAATVSVLDAGNFTAAATVEAALAEIYQHLVSVQKFVSVPLATVLEGDATNIVGALGPATTPKLDMINGDTDTALAIQWAATDVSPLVFQVPLPPNLDDAAAVVIHLRAKMSGAADTPVINGDIYINEGDTKVEAATAALSNAYAEKTITIAAGDVPVGAQTLTCELTPGTHGTDAILMTAIWVEYKGTVLAS